MNSKRTQIQIMRAVIPRYRIVSNISDLDDVFDEDNGETDIDIFDDHHIGDSHQNDQNDQSSRCHSFVNDANLTSRTYSFDSTDLTNKLIFDLDPRVRSFSCDLDHYGKGHNMDSIAAIKQNTHNLIDLADKMVWSLDLSEIHSLSKQSVDDKNDIAKDNDKLANDFKKYEILETISGFNSHHGNQETSIWNTISTDISHDMSHDTYR
ncbi:unnamed protein product [Owenia fusiformis]|uniref:Uncharacterized protein n=1 Tax=Owenia fusiformis TaxID=6347 RepID=A0A8S4N6M8_OWEFU|nr:unnamed protein product [Owenia fusiformis]